MILPMYEAHIVYRDGYKLNQITKVRRRNGRSIRHAANRILEINSENIIEIKIYNPDGDLIDRAVVNH